MVHFYLKYRSNKVDLNKMHYFSKYVPAVNIVCKFENYCFNSFGLAISVKFVSGLFSSVVRLDNYKACRPVGYSPTTGEPARRLRRFCEQQGAGK